MTLLDTSNTATELYTMYIFEMLEQSCGGDMAFPKKNSSNICNPISSFPSLHRLSSNFFQTASSTTDLDYYFARSIDPPPDAVH